MAILTIGERLDDEGNPIPGTGFEYDSDGEVAELIAQRASPILYTPAQNEWVWELDVSDESNGEFDRFVAVCPAGNQGTITHYHPKFDELFKGVSGTFRLEADGEEVILEAGEEFMVKRGVLHSFRCIGEDGDLGVLVAETYPAVGFTELMFNAFGLAIEGKTKSTGEPNILQMMVILRNLQTSYGITAEDLMIPVPPGPTVIAIMSRILAPLGRLLGYKPDYPHYREDEFWEKHINQPPK
mgnify:FL=1